MPTSVIISKINFTLSSVQQEKNVKIIGILKLTSRINFMQIWVETEKGFMTSGPELFTEQFTIAEKPQIEGIRYI